MKFQNLYLDAFKEYKFKMEGFNNQAQIVTPKIEE